MFRLDLSDEEADHFILSLVDMSLTAVMPELFEKIHRVAQALR